MNQPLISAKPHMTTLKLPRTTSKKPTNDSKIPKINQSTREGTNSFVPHFSTVIDDQIFDSLSLSRHPLFVSCAGLSRCHIDATVTTQSIVKRLQSSHLSHYKNNHNYLAWRWNFSYFVGMRARSSLARSTRASFLISILALSLTFSSRGRAVHTQC
jgi:hypothetical protein